MTEGKYRTHELCQFDYSDIWEKSFDERYTDTPLRNDEIIKLLNEQEKRIEKLEKENSDLKVLVEDLAKKGGFNKHILKVINGDVDE